MAANHETIILIGPEGAGKSTIGKLLADRLSKELYSLDRHRQELYAPYSYDNDHANKLYEEQGDKALLEYWKYFEYQATSHILQHALKPGDEFYGKILDFGAGHSIYEDPKMLERIASLSHPYSNIFLVLPCEDVEEAMQITESRRGQKLNHNRLFLEHPSNKTLAKYTIYTKDKDPQSSEMELLKYMNVKA